MAKLSVHPHQGYLNTKFTILSFSRNHKMVKIKPKDNGAPLLHENDFRPILSFELLDDQTLQLQETFPFTGRYAIEFPDDKDSAVEIEVKDAIKFGGSTHKSSCTFMRKHL